MASIATYRHHPRYHEFVEGSAKVIELVEDMRPFVHIFFTDIFPPIMVMVLVTGAYRALREDTGFKAIRVVDDTSATRYGCPAIVSFRHHGMHV